MASLGQCQPVLDGFARHTCQPSASANETQPCVGLWGQRGVAEGGLSLVIDQKWLERWPGSDLSCCWTMLDRLDHSEPLTDARMLHRNSTPVGAAATQTANGIRPAQMQLEWLEAFRCLRSQCDDHAKIAKFFRWTVTASLVTGRSWAHTLRPVSGEDVDEIGELLTGFRPSKLRDCPVSPSQPSPTLEA